MQFELLNLLLNILVNDLGMDLYNYRNAQNTRKLRKLNWQHSIFAISFLLISNLNMTLVQANPGIKIPARYKITVNSNQDGEITADNFITLREAIAIINGDLQISQLSPTEQNQIQTLNSNQSHGIEFNLPQEQTIIKLEKILPALSTPNLIIDGTTQPGYNPDVTVESSIPNVEGSIAKPLVTITPAVNREIFRGFTITADNVTIRGLNLYGFTSTHNVTATTPPADIFITAPSTNFSPRPGSNQQNPDNQNSQPPRNITIENNWLGITGDETMPKTTSAFGVSVFNGIDTIIRRNRISHHDGSGIITGINAEGTQIRENMIIGNGIAGMPDAIRLEGKVNRTQIQGNLMCANDGSGVFLFKPEGAVNIKNNQIKHNGRRLRRAAIYLMGSDHQVMNNEISNQTASGVVVTAFPNGGSFTNGAAVRNRIENNQFASLEGLSIDLNTRGHVDVQDFQRGDGKNPPRTSPNRRLDTGNAAINAPEFLSQEFLQVNGQVNIDGKSEPNSQVQIYKVGENALKEIITVVSSDEKGKFGTTLKGLTSGDIISAIATHDDFGTSEPARYATIRNLNNQNNQSVSSIIVREASTEPLTPTSQPNCLSKPKPPEPPEPEPVPTPDPTPPPIRLRIPTNIHFALDKDFISKESGQVLDQIVDVLKQYPTFVIELQGHTDSRASDAYNKDLARRRARNTRNYLIKQGIAPERMTIRSFGERKLKTPGRDRVEHARNRRVEVIFFDTRGIDIIFEEQDADLQIEGKRNK